MVTRSTAITRSQSANPKIAIDSSWFVYAAALACIPLAFAVYWPFIGTFFVSDDFVVLRAVRGYSALDIVTRAFGYPTSDALHPATGSWRPLTDLYFYAMSPFGLHAQSYHVVNIGLHGLVGAIAALLIWRISGSARSGVVAALMFTVAPTFQFLVTWNVEISELTEAACLLTALVAYHAYLTSPVAKPRLLVAAFALTALAIVSKESSVLLLILMPGMVWLTRLVGSCRRSNREIASGLLPIIFVLVAYAAMLAIRRLAQHDSSNGAGYHTMRNFWDYLRWVVFPFRFGEFMALRAAAAALFLGIGIVTMAARRYVLAAFFVWTIITLAFYSQNEVLELRYTYLATLGLIAFIVYSVDAALTRLSPHRQRLALVPLGLLLAATLAASAIQARDQQEFITAQAKAYSTALDGIRSLCGPLPPGSYVYVVGSPVYDAYELNMPAAVNLYYDHVYAVPVDSVPPLAAFIEHKCAIQYDTQTANYLRIE